MSSGNESIVRESTQEFQCCCSIDHTTFDIDGKGAVQKINCILTVPTSLSATLGNLLVLISIWRTPSLHSPSNILLVGLALSDLGVGLVVQPIFFVYNIAQIKRLASLFCSTGEALVLTGHWFCATSLFTLSAISVDRYMSLYLHLRYKELITVKRVTVLLVNIWLFSFVCSLLFLWYDKILATPLYLLLFCAFYSLPLPIIKYSGLFTVIGPRLMFKYKSDNLMIRKKIP